MVDITAELYAAYRVLLVDDTYPTIEGLREIQEIQADIDLKAVMAKIKDFIALRFVDEKERLSRAAFGKELTRKIGREDMHGDTRSESYRAIPKSSPFTKNWPTPARCRRDKSAELQIGARDRICRSAFDVKVEAK